jgi:hypothetical protein
VNRNEHKRVKHGHVPGDISKADKITMREGRSQGADIVLSPWHTISSKAAKVYRKMLQKKGKKRQRRRDQERIQEELK